MKGLLASGFVLAQAQAQARVLVDQVGYEPAASKRAVLMSLPAEAGLRFEVVEAGSGRVVLSGKPVRAGMVDRWNLGLFWTADFSAVQAPGEYLVRVVAGTQPIAASSPFAVQRDVLERETLSDVIFYFKGQRASGALDRADRHLRVPDLRVPGSETFVDVHGGWYDATGDYGIHLSHQNLTSYFNPQQVPLVAWSLLSSYNALRSRGDDNFSEYQRRLLDEGLFGADFLVRMKRPDGSFFESINAPGKDKLAQDREIGNPNWRTQIKTDSAASTEEVHAATGAHAYEASFRAGGGMAIAALALASTMAEDGEFSRVVYLHTAEAAFNFLQAHNRELLNDGQENILDDYCALLAASELYDATHERRFQVAAEGRADALRDRLITEGRHRDFWRANAGRRPFFHPSDAGLPVVALLRYAETAGAGEPLQIERVKETVRRSLASELATTAETANPFGYARQLVRTHDGLLRTAFFFPHDTEAAPWWQGENARLACLAAAARMARPLFRGDPAFQAALEGYAEDQLHWILGRNPYDSSLLMGSGHGNAAYMFFGSYKYTSAPGAVINGVTAAAQDEDGIAFNQGYAVTGKDEDWRWTEEWLPHAAWYLYAISLPHR